MLTFSRLGHIGRFGNQLFQIASTIGLAKKYGYAYGFPAWKNYDHMNNFGSTEDIDLQKYFLHPLPQIDTSNYKDFPVSWGWHPSLRPPDNVSLSGHMQSEKYFAHCKDLIQHYFTMKDEYEQNEKVAIHVRLGDYDDKYHPRLGMDYYTKAMALFPPGTDFMLFSDDIRSAADMFGWSRPTVGKAGYIEEFKFMKSFKHFITGNSSYSLMAAMLGRHPDKKIVCPSNWFGEAWGSGYKEMSKDIYPQNAIVI